MPIDAWKTFWTEAFSLKGAATFRVLPSVIAFGVVAHLICLVSRAGFNLGVELGPYEVAGAMLGLLLVLRTNAGYERWWEARKLWGGIVNQSRNLALVALAYGPDDRRWREQVVRWTAAFAHAARASLRGQRDLPELDTLLGREQADRVRAARHMPSSVAQSIGALLGDACRRRALDRFAFLQAERERATLIDHIGACERILKTPLARVYSIKIRRFIALYLATLPFALLHKFENNLLVPLVTMLVAYAVLGLDQIGIELQNPFSTGSLSHLPLDDIALAIEQDLQSMLDSEPGSKIVAAGPTWAGPLLADGAGARRREPRSSLKCSVEGSRRICSVPEDVGGRPARAVAGTDVGQRRAGVSMSGEILQVDDVAAPLSGRGERRHP